MMRVTILGSGTSKGIPIIGCKCPACTSSNPKDKRLRVSVYIDMRTLKEGSSGSLKLLIDTAPDFRQQMLVNNLDDVDAVLYTHPHMDHIMGLDDISQINYIHKKSVGLFGNNDTIDYIRKAFSYIFDENTYRGGGLPDVKTCVIPFKTFSVGSVEITPIKYFHGPSIVWGYRIGDFAYMTDCSKIPDEEYPKLQNLKILVIDALRYKPHPTHLSIDEAISEVEKIKPIKAYFTHMTHDVLHDEVNAKLPEGIELAYDGLTFDV